MQTRRRQIEDVASALFSSRGYAATSMRDIARALDLQGGSLYSHIPSKEAVLAAIVEEAAEEFHAAVRPVAERPGPAAERLREMVAAHVRVVTGGRERAKVSFRVDFLGEERRGMHLVRRLPGYSNGCLPRWWPRGAERADPKRRRSHPPP